MVTGFESRNFTTFFCKFRSLACVAVGGGPSTKDAPEPCNCFLLFALMSFSTIGFRAGPLLTEADSALLNRLSDFSIASCGPGMGATRAEPLSIRNSYSSRWLEFEIRVRGLLVLHGSSCKTFRENQVFSPWLTGFIIPLIKKFKCIQIEVAAGLLWVRLMGFQNGKHF